MKRSIFNIIFIFGVVFVLFPMFVNAQKKKTATKKKSVSAPTTTKKSIPTPPTMTLPITVTPTTPVISNTPANVSLSSDEQAILDEINAVRNDPQKYIGYLEEYRKNFNGDKVSLSDGTVVITNEGVAGVDDALNFLRKTGKLSSYTLSTGLTQSANLQLKDLMENSSIGHKSKDGGNLTTRLDKFGTVGNIYAENITHLSKTPQEIVLAMIIDDGYKSRAHRKNLFSSEFKIIGLGFGIGKNGESLSVTVFADSFKEKP
jgi:uncharacterized protein YkwD